jgi:hypothetical protein
MIHEQASDQPRLNRHDDGHRPDLQKFAEWSAQHAMTAPTPGAAGRATCVIIVCTVDYDGIRRYIPEGGDAGSAKQRSGACEEFRLAVPKRSRTAESDSVSHSRSDRRRHPGWFL